MNMVNTDITFIGRKNRIDELKNTLTKIEENDDYRLSAVLERKIGYYTLEGIDRRSYVEEVRTDNENSVSVKLREEKSPKEDLFYLIGMVYGVEYVYISEEPSSRIFINTDLTGKYYDKRYRLHTEWHIDLEDEYASSNEDLCKKYKLFTKKFLQVDEFVYK